jgi:hypothetical protein
VFFSGKLSGLKKATGKFFIIGVVAIKQVDDSYNVEFSENDPDT